MMVKVVLLLTLVTLISVISTRVCSREKGENEVPVIIIERKRRYGRGKGLIKKIQSLD